MARKLFINKEGDYYERNKTISNRIKRAFELND